MEEVPLGIALRSGVAEQSLRIGNQALLLHDRKQGATESEVIGSPPKRSCTRLPVQTQRFPHPNGLWRCNLVLPSLPRAAGIPHNRISAFYGKFNIFVKREK